MLIYHTSDWHLGRMLYGRSLLEDQRYFLEEIFLPQVERERPAAVILAGDIYDRQVASLEAIRLFDQTLERLMALNCKVLAIAGNHDGAGRIALLKSALRRSGVYLATELADALEPVELEQDGQRVQVFLLPYFDPPQARAFFGDPELRGEGPCMERAVQAMLPRFQEGAVHLLAAHCFAAGASVCDSESLMVGGSGQTPPALFDLFDYAALGHLHRPQRAGEKGRYSGSPLKYSISEAGQKKCFLRLEIENGVQVQPVEYAPLRDVRQLSGTFDWLSQEAQASQDYVELVLEDSAPVLLAAQRLRPNFPNLLSVVNNWAAASAAGGRAARLKDLGEEEIFAAFFQETCGQEPEEADRALFRRVLEEAREQA